MFELGDVVLYDRKDGAFPHLVNSLGVVRTVAPTKIIVDWLITRDGTLQRASDYHGGFDLDLLKIIGHIPENGVDNFRAVCKDGSHDADTSST